MPVYRPITFAPCLLPLALACSGPQPDKGTEEDQPTDGKYDSFQSPTPHGELEMLGDNRAEFADGSLFHTWTFELTASAEVLLATDALAANLDTVMYLYHRDSSSDSWGSFRFKNDDHDGLLTSRLEKTLEAGEWRVLVKPFKSAMRGEFEILATCDGAGCPPVAGSCGGTLPAHLQLSSKFSIECGERIVNLLDGGIFPSSKLSSAMSFAQRCQLDPLERSAVELYRSYWDSKGDWDALEPDPVGAPLAFEVETFPLDTHTAAGQTIGGTVIVVDTTIHDEDLIYFLFDSNDELVALIHDKNDPVARYYCEGGTPGDDPGGECMIAYVQTMMRSADAETGFDASFEAADASNALDSLSTTAAIAFIQEGGLADDVQMGVDVVEWEPELGLGGAIVAVDATGHESATYRVGDDGSVLNWILTVDRGDGERFVCEN